MFAVWETSTVPATSRTAPCSSRIESKETGISQPPKSVNRASRRSWRSYSSDRRSDTVPWEACPPTTVDGPRIPPPGGGEPFH